jgi:hypothetical protein
VAKRKQPVEKLSSSKTLGAKADELLEIDDRVRAIERKLRIVKSKREKMRVRMVAALRKTVVDGVRGAKAIVNISTKRIPQVKKRALLDKYMRQHKAYDLLANHINSRAYFDRLERGEAVPGVAVFERTSVSVRRRK